MTLTAQEPAAEPQAKPSPKRRPRARRQSSLASHGEPMVWLTGGSLALCVLMIFGLLALVLYQGGATFWPREIVRVELFDGTVLMGEVSRAESYAPEEQMLAALDEEKSARISQAAAEGDGETTRRMLRTENFDLTDTHYDWVEDSLVTAESRPEWAVVVERTSKGRFYGLPTGFAIDGETVAEGPEEAWRKLEEHHGTILDRVDTIHGLEQDDLGVVNARMESARLDLRAVALKDGLDSSAWRAQKEVHDAEMAEAEESFREITGEIASLRAANARYQMTFETANGVAQAIPLDQIVRAVPANQLSFGERASVYGSRWGEFLTAEPREANSEGGVWPAFFGTVIMTLIMSVLVVPIGVLAALYLHEYAKQGVLVSIVRVAVNNLAGVPSIVFGVFGLGFFCYIIGASIDDLFFSARLPNPTYGKGGILWASLTLALLTLPVVIVATEEALSAVPNSMREGSYACGATKWQTIRRIVLPRAQPGIMTGTILAIARGAGEVAPLMLVGAVKLAPDLPVDLARFPYIFPERSFMHLGFHIFDVGFQSQNSEAAKPMVFTTTLLLIGIVVLLNVIAISIRARLRRRFQGA